MTPLPKQVAISGIGMVTALGNNSQSTFDSLFSGKNGITEVKEWKESNFPIQVAGQVKNFNDLLEKTPEARCFNSRKAIFAVTALREAMKQAGGNFQEGRGGLFLGVETGRIDINKLFGMFLKAGSSKGLDHDLFGKSAFHFISRYEALSKQPFFIPNLLSNVFGLTGEIRSISNACSSSSQAVGEGFRKVATGELDWAIVGGTDDMIDLYMAIGFQLLGALSSDKNPETACRPFDGKRKGFVLGEGAGMLLIENTERAVKRGVKPIALISGYSSGASATKITETTSDGILFTMDQAMQAAGVDKNSVDYINAHGTGTPMNDPAENFAIKTLFGEKAFSIPINSTKSMIGHLIAAGGAVEAAVVARSIQEGKIHPTINLENPDPHCDLDYVPKIGREIPIRNGLSNSLGFAGINSTLVLSKFEG
ncbi:MAG: beta-ketoacyl-[acyl-carrier-protein] synthase family protein [Candidatus Riflebacteria bacterium]|nr:beta-ketoacyl-[acyl-carrier-protein] synthase family protein [Candidatus Riflebacteria bacterium]